ncbi:hypothetical protein N0V83_005420 [Neocucurbitaria cava]|uniref:Uncharacterized protein n=1 Tax=Neocucurbitaria cava TaxID=798079 RepID=A0A9W8Y6Q6_9PLEO|nr:hypothetical protein N0V83_005420 [Neocucurbitaria cava]
MLNHLTTLLTLSSLLLSTHAGILQKDFTGTGHIYVLQSSDWPTASPKQKVGCLSDAGRFVKDDSQDACGVFSRLDDFPRRIRIVIMGKGDNAWSCVQGHQSDIYDELYTIDGFPYVFLCFGDVACYYDAKHTPDSNEALSLWQFRWGSEQRGITPGHVQLQLLWKKLGDLPKREGEEVVIPGPRVELKEGVQVPLMGGRARE